MTANYHLKDKAALIEVSFSPMALQNSMCACMCMHLCVCSFVYMHVVDFPLKDIKEMETDQGWGASALVRHSYRGKETEGTDEKKGGDDELIHFIDIKCFVFFNPSLTYLAIRHIPWQVWPVNVYITHLARSDLSKERKKHIHTLTHTHTHAHTHLTLQQHNCQKTT